MTTNLRARLCAIVACSGLLASCGGGGDGGGSGCELVSEGPSKLTIRNSLSTGVEATLPQFSFGAHMYSGECIVIGLDARGTTSSIRVDLTRCNNSFSNTSCDGRLVPPTRSVTVNLPQGGAATLEVTANLF